MSETLRAHAEGVAAAAALLRAGGLVAFPTETVYGLGANALDADAVARIFTAKGRPPNNPLIVHIAGSDDLDALASTVTPLARQLALRWWPGPLTLVLDTGPGVPYVTTGGHRTIGLRAPAHPLAQELLLAAGVPVAAPSANRSGRPSPTTAAHVIADLGAAVDLVLDGGPCRVGVESTVVDARGTRPVVLREGAVSREQLGLDAGAASQGGVAAAAAPGQRYQHYRPRCRVVVAPVGRGVATAATLAAAHQDVGLIAPECAPAGRPGVRTIATYDGAEQLAQVLYGGLRAAEDAGVAVVVVEAVLEAGIGRAVMDRVRRAAGPE